MLPASPPSITTRGKICNLVTSNSEALIATAVAVLLLFLLLRLLLLLFLLLLLLLMFLFSITTDVGVIVVISVSVTVVIFLLLLTPSRHCCSIYSCSFRCYCHRPFNSRCNVTHLLIFRHRHTQRTENRSVHCANSNNNNNNSAANDCLDTKPTAKWPDTIDLMMLVHLQDTQLLKEPSPCLVRVRVSDLE